MGGKAEKGDGTGQVSLILSALTYSSANCTCILHCEISIQRYLRTDIALVV